MPGSTKRRRGRPEGITVVPGAVRRAREEVGLSQAQLARPLLTGAAIHLIEQGRARPSLRTLRHIASRTDRPLDYFLPNAGGDVGEPVDVNHLKRLVETGEFATAIEFGGPLTERPLPRRVEADVRFWVARAHVRTLDGESAYPHLVRARELYELTGDSMQFADTLSQLGCALYLMDDPRSLAVAYQALDAAERLRPQQPELTVRTLIALGLILIRLQDWPRAARHYELALRMVTAAPTIRHMAMIHDHLSLVYQQMGKFGGALEHARRAAQLYEGSPDPSDVFRSEHNLGYILLKQGELAAAAPHLDRALRLCREHGLERYLRGFGMLSKAELLIALGELDAAEAALTEATDLVQQLDERVHQATAWRLWGRLLMHQGRQSEAGHAFDCAVRLLEQLQLTAEMFEVLAEHAEALKDQGRLLEALEKSSQAIASGRTALRHMQGGSAEIVAAAWQA